jgi:arsenate reductase
MPAETMNPVAKTALEELGVAILDGIPKKLEDAMVQTSDVVITMGCGDACTIYPGKNYLDWKLEDPAGQGIESVRAIRNDIDQRVRLLLKELFPEKDFSKSVIN